MRVRRAWLIVLAFAALAFVGSLVVGSTLFEHLSNNNDEPVYILEAKQLRDGHLTLSATAHGDAFRPWMSGRTGENRLVLVEQPVLPTLMAASDLLFGSMRFALAFVAAGSVVAVFGAARVLTRDERVALATAAVFVLSPLVIAQSGLYLSYLLAVTLAAVVVILLARAMERDSWRLFLAAGLVHGLLFFTRPIESLMLVPCFFIWMLARGEGARRAFRNLLLMACGALPIAVLCFAYNTATTGNPLRFPLWAIGGNDAFGFGDRTIAEGGPPIHFGPAEAWHAMRSNLRAFPHWLFGGLVAIPLIVWGAVLLWRQRRSSFWLLAAIGVVIPIGYFFYYGNYLIIAGRIYFGPHYYLQLLLPATVFMGVALVDLFRRRSWMAALVPLLIVATAVEIPNKIDVNMRVQHADDREMAAVDGAVHEPAVVVLPAGVDGPYVLHPRGEFGNSPSLDDPVLYAADLQGRNNELFGRYPNRAIYRLQTVQGTGGARTDVRALQQMRGSAFAVPITVDAFDPGRPTALTYAFVNGASAVCVLTDAPHGSATLTPTAIVLHGCFGGDKSVPVPLGPASVVLGAAISPTIDPAQGEQVEQRIWTDNTPAGVVFVTPADLWHRNGRGPYSVVDPNVTPWATFGAATA